MLTKLPASVETLAETLKKAGYQTGAIVSGFDILVFVEWTGTVDFGARFCFI